MYTTINRFRSSNRCAGKTRLVIGGACWDNYLTADTLVLDAKNRVHARRQTIGGGGANLALGHQRLALDRRIILLAGIGDDQEGEALRQYLVSRGIEMPWEVLPQLRTSASFVITHLATGKGTILTEPGAREALVPLRLVREALRSAEVCSLIGPALNEQIGPVLALANREGVPVFFGLGSQQVSKLTYLELRDLLDEGVEMMICNRKEAFGLTGCPGISEQLALLEFDKRVHTVVITDGSEGIYALRDETHYHVSAYTDPTRPAVDDTGAGDAAHAAIGDAILRGYPLEVALHAGARQGFEAVTGFGASSQQLDGVAMREYLSLAAGIG